MNQEVATSALRAEAASFVPGAHERTPAGTHQRRPVGDADRRKLIRKAEELYKAVQYCFNHWCALNIIHQ